MEQTDKNSDVFSLDSENYTLDELKAKKGED